MRMKKWLSFLLSAAIAATLAPPDVIMAAAPKADVWDTTAAEGSEGGYADTIDGTISGTFGQELTWNIDREGNFKIEGTGKMPDIKLSEDIPWNDYRSEIKSVVVGEGITNIGDLSFYDCEQLTEVSLPDSLTEIGPVAFAYCSKLDGLTLANNITKIGDLALFTCTGISEMVIPSSVLNIGNDVFRDCKSLKNIYFLGNAPAFGNNQVFDGDTLTLHYPAGAVTGWDELKATGFGADNITWRAGCYGNNHVWETDYRVDTEASCTSEGSKSIHCTLCDETKDRQVIRGGHTYETVVTKATVSQNGKLAQRCLKCGTEASSQTIYAPKTVTLEKASYQYSKKAFTPAVAVTDNSGQVIPPNCYTVSYSNNTAVGTASVNITFQGNYSGTLTSTFVINPKGTSISKLKAKTKGFVVKWKKQSVQTSGYQIQYAQNNKMKSAKTVKIGNSKTKTKTISKLKARKKYFVRIRTFKTVKGVKYYSSWSAVKKITTK